MATEPQSTYQGYSPSKQVVGKRRVCGPEAMGPSLPQENTSSTNTHNPSKTCGAEQQAKPDKADVLTARAVAMTMADAKGKANQMANKCCCNFSNTTGNIKHPVARLAIHCM